MVSSLIFKYENREPSYQLFKLTVLLLETGYK